MGNSIIIRDLTGGMEACFFNSMFAIIPIGIDEFCKLRFFRFGFSSGIDFHKVLC